MKDKATVFVKVQGLCGTGKTTLAIKLARALKAQGIQTEVWESDNSYQDITDEDVDRNLKGLSSRINVIIQTEQLNRHCA